MYNSLSFSIQNSNSYSSTSQTFMLQGSHMGLSPMMLWAGSPAAGQPPMWLPPSLPAGYWPPPPLGGYWSQAPSGGYWSPPPPVGHPGQSSSTPPHLLAMYISHHRRGHLQLEGKPHCGECLHGRHRSHSRNDLLLCHIRQVICAYF
jgi:hypothetical protein